MGDDPAWRGEYEKPQPYGTHGQQVGKRQPLERRQCVVSQHRAPQPGGRPEPAVINESVAGAVSSWNGSNGLAVVSGVFMWPHDTSRRCASEVRADKAHASADAFTTEPNWLGRLLE